MKRHQTLCYTPFAFCAPTTISISGCTGSGKTTWIKRLLEHKDELFSIKPTKVLYCYAIWQPLFLEMKGIQFHEGLPSSEEVENFTDGSHVLIVLDDLMDSVIQDVQIQRLFTLGSHHKNITVLFINQNLFCQGKCARTISLNCHYVILFKNPRDVHQIHLFGRQIGMPRTLVEAYQDCMSEPYAYLIVDLSPHSCSPHKLITHIFSDEDTIAYEPL